MSWRCALYNQNNIKLVLFITSERRGRKIINHHIAEGMRESNPRVHDVQHPRLGQPRRGLQIMDTRMGFPCPFRNAVIDSINLKAVFECYWTEYTNYFILWNFTNTFTVVYIGQGCSQSIIRIWSSNFLYDIDREHSWSIYNCGYLVSLCESKSQIEVLFHSKVGLVDTN